MRVYALMAGSRHTMHINVCVYSVHILNVFQIKQLVVSKSENYMLRIIKKPCTVNAK